MATADKNADIGRTLLIGAGVGAFSAAFGMISPSISGIGGTLFNAATNFSVGVMGNLASQRFIEGKHPSQYDENEALFAGFTNMIFSGLEGSTKNIISKNYSASTNGMVRVDKSRLIDVSNDIANDVNGILWSLLGSKFEEICKPLVLNSNVKV